jgi:hypothetical protein
MAHAAALRRRLGLAAVGLIALAALTLLAGPVEAELG